MWCIARDAMRVLREPLRGTGMAGMGLSDNRVARDQRAGKIAAGNGIEGERKVIRPEHQHGFAQAVEPCAQAGLGGRARRHARLRRSAGGDAGLERARGLALRAGGGGRRAHRSRSRLSA